MLFLLYYESSVPGASVRQTLFAVRTRASWSSFPEPASIFFRATLRPLPLLLRRLHRRASSRAFAEKMSTRQTDARIAKEMSLLRILAHSQFRRTLHDVPRDGACQFASLLHALSTQLRPPRAIGHTVVSIRRALTDFFAGHPVQLYEGPLPDRAAVDALFSAVLGPVVLRPGEQLAEWCARMQMPFEWGDEATLLAATALFRVRIHVVSRATDAGATQSIAALTSPASARRSSARPRSAARVA